MTPILWQMSNGRPLLELDLLLQAFSLRVRERFTAYNLDRGEDVINMCLLNPREYQPPKNSIATLLTLAIYMIV